ncbi:MAG: helix-turn-helix domain-containing protein [Ginsengibacter sp.]
MTNTDAMHKQIHQGRNVKRFREMLGIKQEALAIELGDDWNQQKISLLEQKETIDNGLLKQVSAALKIPAEAIENFDEDAAINVIANTFNNHDHSNPQFASFISNTPTFNPLEKMIELYERMLQQQKEIIEKLEKLLEKKF